MIVITNFKQTVLHGTTVITCEEDNWLSIRARYYFVIDSAFRYVEVWECTEDNRRHIGSFIGNKDSLRMSKGITNFVIGEDNVKACREWMETYKNIELHEIVCDDMYSWCTLPPAKKPTSYKIPFNKNHASIVFSGTIVRMLMDKEVKDDPN